MARIRSASRVSVNGRTRRGRNARGSDTAAVVTQITQLVAANEALQRQNRELADDNNRLRGELAEIGSALGRLTVAPRGRRRGAAAVTLPEATSRRRRKPITDPEILAKRAQALMKARAARAEKLAAAKAEAASGN